MNYKLSMVIHGNSDSRGGADAGLRDNTSSRAGYITEKKQSAADTLFKDAHVTNRRAVAGIWTQGGRMSLLK
jgi:hypothetical protein